VVGGTVAPSVTVCPTGCRPHREQIMNARHALLPAPSAMRRLRVTILGALAVVCAAVLLLPAAATAGGPPTGTFAADGDDAELFPRIENSTFPLPPRASETAPWRRAR
jgi:hypothetical protein